jgi:tetratricopeptide (TPR) repeat protein
VTRDRCAFVVVVLVALGMGAPLPAEPPEKLTPEQRKELEAKWQELNTAIGQAYSKGQLPTATKVAREALDVARQLYPTAEYLDGHKDLATSLNHLGLLLKLQGKYADAETFQRDALAMRQRLYGKTDHPDLAQSLYNLGCLLQSQEKVAEAETFLRDALAMDRRLYGETDHPELARSLNALGSLLGAQGKDAEAERFYRDALAMRQRLFDKTDHPNLAQSLNNLAALLGSQGKYAEAERFYRDALAMRQRLSDKTDHPELARSLSNLGLVLKSQGKYAEAEQFYRNAVAMRQRLSGKADDPGLATSLSNLGSLLDSQGKYAEAETLHRAALAMRQRLHGKTDHPDLAHSLNSMGSLLQSQGKYAEAEPFFRDALTMNQRLYGKTDHPELAYSLNSIGVLLQVQGKYAEAEPVLRDTLAMRQRLHGNSDHPQLARSLSNLGTALRDQGKHAEAETLHRAALAMNQRLYDKSDHPELAHSLNDLGSLLQLQEKYAEAEPFDRAALAMFRRLVDLYAGARSDGEALTLLSSLPLTRDVLLSNARLGRLDPATAYSAVWDSKAALARVFESRHLAARAAGAADPRAALLLDQLTEARHRRADLILAPEPADPATRQKRVEDLKDLTARVQHLEADLRPLLPAVPRLEKLAAATPTDLQKALPADAVVIDFLAYTFFEQDPARPGRAGEKHARSYLAFVLTRNKVIRVELGSAADIDRAVVLWRQAITGPGQQVPADLSRDVRRLVWDKVRPELPREVKTVFLCPDGTLTQLPWGAMPGDKPDTILLEDYALTLLPHAPFLLDKFWPDDPRPEGHQRPESVLAVGGVAYDAEAPLQGPLAKRGDPLLKPGQSLQWTVLKGAEAEVKGVRGAAATKQLAFRLLDGNKATAAAVLGALPKVRYAHLATHGFFADKDFRSVLRVDPQLFEKTWRGERVGAGALSPMVMSGLVFAGANKPDTPGRGVVTGEALIDLDLSGLEMVVLSACETGLGDVADGQGVFGLQRAFHVAGTRNVVASLWQVHDEATAALMALFYRNLWDKDMTPMEALRQAQLEIYRHPDKIPELAKGWRGTFKVVSGTGVAEGDLKPEGGKAHPRLWAAFTLSGPGTLGTTRP